MTASVEKTQWNQPQHLLANVGVAGSRPSFARLAHSARREAARACEPGLVLQEDRRPGRTSCDRAFLVRVMVGGLLGPLPPPAHPQQRHQAAQPRGQQQPARGFGGQHDVGSPIEDTERLATVRPLRG